VTRGPLAAVALVAVAAIAIVAGCAASPSPTPGPVETASIIDPASATPGAGVPASPVDGVLTHIDAQGLTDVTGFTLRTNDGTELPFRIGVLENGAEFPPGHLAEHLATSSPVRVFFRDAGGVLVVYRLEDAPTP
jgi:hypothetical protein